MTNEIPKEIRYYTNMFPPNRQIHIFLLTRIAKSSLNNLNRNILSKPKVALSKMRFSTLFLFVVIVIVSFLNETEGRRKILRGRKTITRTYYKSLGIPAWFSVTLIAFGILGVTGIIFAALQKIIITNNQPPQSSPATVPLTS